MSEDYVEWDVHATNDALTPRVEYDDPLSQFSESEVSLHTDCMFLLPMLIRSSTSIIRRM